MPKAKKDVPRETSKLVTGLHATNVRVPVPSSWGMKLSATNIAGVCSSPTRSPEHLSQAVADGLRAKFGVVK